MNRVFERAERESGTPVRERIKVGVTGCGAQSGATFVATALAWYAAHRAGRRAAYAELTNLDSCFCGGSTGDDRYAAGNRYAAGSTRLFDALGMDKRFLGREFTDFFALLARGASIRRLTNPDEKINWALQVPEDLRRRRETARNAPAVSPQPGALLALRLANNIEGDFVVCDFGSGAPQEALCEDMDLTVCVVDPKPSKLIAGAEQIGRLRRMALRGHRVFWVVNKDNGGVNRREFRDFLRKSTEKEFRIPLLDERLFYSAEYNCEMAALHKEIRAQTEEIFCAMLDGAL